MARIDADNQDQRPVRGTLLSLNTPGRTDPLPTEGEKCELILWIEGEWRCEYWRLGESGKMRLLNGLDTVLDAPVADPTVALHEVKVWRQVVLHGGVPSHA